MPVRIPELAAVLARLGLGQLESAAAVATLPGRNENLAGRTDQGVRIFVKRFRGPAAEARRRLRRSAAFERWCAERVPGVVPRSLGWDEQALLMVSEFVEDGTTFAELAADEMFGTDHAARAGHISGLLHSQAEPAGVPADGRPALPSRQLLTGLTLRQFDACSAGELKAWRLMQDDPVLVRAVGALLDQEERAPRVPAHCDLRLDQFLLSGERVFVTDGEEFRLADAARDIGMFAGDLMYRAVTGWADSDSLPSADNEVVRCCARRIQQAVPVLAAFWSGYRRARSVHDPGLAERAAAFAGWHMFDRLLARAQRSVRVSAVDRAAAGHRPPDHDRSGAILRSYRARSAVTAGLSERLASVLPTIVVGVDRRTARVGPREVSAASPASLRSELATAIYDESARRPGHDAAPSRPVPAR